MLHSWIKWALVGMMAASLAACGQQNSGGSKEAYRGVKVGKPYTISGEWYTPKYEPSYDQVGMASWYGPGFHGKKTSYGDTFNTNALTAAHPTLPMPSMLEVTNLANGRKVIVRVNDRGPFSKSRIVDLSKAAAEKLDMIRTGTAKVRVRYLKEATERYIASKGRASDAYSVASADADDSVNDDWDLDDYRPVARGPSVQAAPIYSVSSSNVATPKGSIFVRDAMADDDVSQYKAPSQLSQEEADGWQQAKAAMPRQLPASKPIAAYPAGDPKKARPTSGSIYVQVGAFGMESNAQKTVNQLSVYGNAAMFPIEANGKKLYRVRLGPMADDDAAQEALAKVRQAGYMDAKITR